MPQSRIGQITGSAFRLMPTAICDATRCSRRMPRSGFERVLEDVSAVMIKDAIDDDVTSLDARGRGR
jgi:hypothetical protein